MSSRYVRYDKQGFTVAWCPCACPEGGLYWHVYHRQYGVRWGHELSAIGAHHAVNFAIGDMRQGVAA